LERYGASTFANLEAPRETIVARTGCTLEQGEALKRSLFLAIAAIALVAVPSVSQAQLGLVKPFSLGVAGGGSLPMSDLSNTSNTGYNGTVAMGINLPFIPVGLRIDGAYNSFGAKALADTKLHVLSATGNLVYRLPSMGVSPYLIGGAGLYMSGVTAPGATSNNENHLGWNAGAGVSLPLTVFKAFVEARYNRISANGASMEFVPVTFGIMF
jgi:Outer membrane protein beta-barrel domain